MLAEMRTKTSECERDPASWADFSSHFAAEPHFFVKGLADIANHRIIGS